MNQEYRKNGFFVVKELFTVNELHSLANVLKTFHESWKAENFEFYAEKAINSAYITGTKYLDDSDRNIIFQFIGSSRLMKIVDGVLSERPTFMNTQLFFNPVNGDQKNYWHRDPQYHMTVEQQKRALSGPDVIHFRIPLAKEPGLELVPGSHASWDTEEELEVRLEKNGRKNHEDLSTGVTIQLNAGDLLVFSGNIIHRGIYGMNRFAFDILLCDPEPDLSEFIEEDCLPNKEVLEEIENPSVFLNAMNLKTNNKLSHSTADAAG